MKLSLLISFKIMRFLKDRKFKTEREILEGTARLIRLWKHYSKITSVFKIHLGRDLTRSQIYSITLFFQETPASSLFFFKVLFEIY